MDYSKEVDFKELFKVLPGLYLILTPDLNIITASEAYLKETFTELNNIAGKHIFEVFPDNPDTPEANSVSNLHYSLKQVLSTAKLHQMDIQHYDIPDPNNPGKFIERYWSPLNTPVLNKEGKVKYIIHQVTNVTEKVKSEKLIKGYQANEKVLLSEIAKQLQWLKSLFEQAPVAIAIFKGPSHVIELANPAVCEIWGRNQHEILGKPLFEALPEIKGIGVEELLENVFNTGIPYVGQEMPVPLVRRGKTDIVYFNFVYQALHDLHNTIDGIIVIANDVSPQVMARITSEESKIALIEMNKELASANEEIQASNEELNAMNEELSRTQDALQDINYQLEERVKERTHDLFLANKELSIANKEILSSLVELEKTNVELARTNSELDNFVYTASHDLKAPIANIEGLISTLKKALPHEILEDEKISSVINYINASVERFRKTIEDLTHISYLQKEGNEEIALVPLLEIIEEVKLDFDILIKSSKAKLKVNISECPTIKFSRKNLRSIIFNLLSNALKYRHADRFPLIMIRSEKHEGYSVLSFLDNGIGLDSTKKAKVFAMFGRLHSHVEGSGVGLYIVKKMLENVGGKIEVESEIGKGTEFKVYFPL